MFVSVRILSVVFLTVFLSACASTEPPVVEAPPPPPPAVVSPLDAFAAVVQGEGEIVFRKGPDSFESVAASGSLTFLMEAPDGSAAAFAVGGTLFLVDGRAGSILKLDEGPAERIYTGAWSVDAQRFHFGYYLPAAGGGMGAGDIRTAIPSEKAVNRVGCSASKAVLSALPDGSLLVRNADNIYQVEADGCRTLRTMDARKLHHVTPSPDGTYLAYILRDLVFNRDRRAYEPDSTLYIESTAGSDPVKVIGDKYAPRHLAWSRDGSELLYDVGPPSGDAMRAVSIYSVADGRSSYLMPPTSTQAVTEAQLSPNGRHALVKVTAEDGQVDWQVKLSGAQFLQSLPLPDADLAFLGWIGDDHLLARTTDGSSHLITVASGTPQQTGLDQAVLWLWPKT